MEKEGSSTERLSYCDFAALKDVVGFGKLPRRFRAGLLTAARKSEAFSLSAGKPVSWQRDQPSMTWHNFACPRFYDPRERSPR